MNRTQGTPSTLAFDKLWRAHEMVTREDGATLLWVDRHFVHEGSFHAFDQLAARGADGRRARTSPSASRTTTCRPRRRGRPRRSRNRAHGRQLDGKRRRAPHPLFGLDDPRQGIVHVVGPEQGLTLPGLLIVCGDSHTSTHGAFGAYAFGIGASEVAHVLMTQTLWQKKPKRMRITVDGKPAAGHRREGHRALDHRAHRRRRRAGPCGRICRQRDSRALDGGPPDAVQPLDRGGRALRHGRAGRDDLRLSAGPAVCAEGRGVRRAVADWRSLPSDRRRRSSTAKSRSTAPTIAPVVTWGTSPEDALPIDGACRIRRASPIRQRAKQMRDALDYMGLRPASS